MQPMRYVALLSYDMQLNRYSVSKCWKGVQLVHTRLNLIVVLNTYKSWQFRNIMVNMQRIEMLANYRECF